jgi:uncharacterized protein YbjT (DUF2867 family)
VTGTLPFSSAVVVGGSGAVGGLFVRALLAEGATSVAHVDHFGLLGRRFETCGETT